MSTDRGETLRRVLVLLLSVVLVAGLSVASPTAAQPREVQPLTPGAVETASRAKSESGRIARTDTTLLGSADEELVPVVVKLDYDPAASYTGGVRGLPATSPSVTGQPLRADAPALRAHDAYAADFERTFADALEAGIPEARIGRSLRIVYGGVSLVLPGNRIGDLLELPNVAAVQRDRLEQPLTDSSPEFIGAPVIYDQLDPAESFTAGAGVIVGVLDSGAWPEHPSYAANPDLPPRPDAPGGGDRTCDFGDNPVTPADDEFECNNKLISGAPFIDLYLFLVGLGLLPPETYETARDSGGHGTHTSTTAAGGYVEEAEIFGVDRGPLHGVAPGAQVAAYKVCGDLGCFSSDSAAAVQQAILDDVDALNFSISGGTSPYTDVVELAFLDAYAAGVFVAASAGNSGPGAATANHLSPWVTTVAASTQNRAFRADVNLSADADELTLSGASLTRGIAAPTFVARADDPAFDYDGGITCEDEAEPGTFDGYIVVCRRAGPDDPPTGRVQKGFNVAHGGAEGMLLYNGVFQQTNTDNHFLPTVHLEAPEGQQLLDFLDAAPETVTATTTDGQAVVDPEFGDIIASFSSRGPAGEFLKPDITAPGVQILAGNSPTPDAIASGPPGQLFQAIAGTSMSSPHIAGSAALVAALHPDWTPGQIKSALLTTARQDLVKEDGTTPADAFDFGSGHVDLTVAGSPGLTFDQLAGGFYDSADDDLNRVDLNVPSVNVQTLPGIVTTTRVARNSSQTSGTWTVSTTAPDGVAMTVTPSEVTLAPGEEATLTITIDATHAGEGQHLGEIRLTGPTALHLPVAFVKDQSSIALDTECEDDSIPEEASTQCTVTAESVSLETSTASIETELSTELRVGDVNGAERTGDRTVSLEGRVLTPIDPAAPSVSAGDRIDFQRIDEMEEPEEPVVMQSIGDEQIINFEGVPEFLYGGETYDTIGITSNGYAVVGGGTSQDVEFEPQDLPDPTPPNNVLAPFWTDLNGTGAPGISSALVNPEGLEGSWLVFEWDVFVFGTQSQRNFQLWIRTDGEEDIFFSYPDGIGGGSS
ncbi:MAG: S8 family serine peptidase, partial [Euzebyaceae bacterium]|nr:S8 family serine peptidase [Euzebyaceae bacterium]